MNAIHSICSLYRCISPTIHTHIHTPKLNKEYEGSAKPLPLSKLINFRNVLCTQSPRKSLKCGNICVYTQHYTSLLLFDFVFFLYSIQIQLEFLLPQAKFVFISQKHLEKWRKIFIFLFQVEWRIFLLF